MKHCLIVDDSSSIRKVASQIFRDLSLRASEAHSHGSAVDACRAEMPDCIVVDWQMPDGEGMDLVADLRKLPDGERPTILYLTSDNDPMQIARAVRNGASGHMLKPFDRDAVAQSLGAAGVI